MASVLLLPENLGEDKRVESILLPRLDTGSTPVSSTKKRRDNFGLSLLFFVLYIVIFWKLDESML